MDAPRDPRYVKALRELEEIVGRNPHLAWGCPPDPRPSRRQRVIRLARSRGDIAALTILRAR